MTHGVAGLLHSAAARRAGRIALIELGPRGRREVTYGELDLAARSAAARLRHAGVEPGDAVALVAANGLGVVAAYFAIAYAGAAIVPIATVSAPPEVAHRLNHARCRAIVFDAARAGLTHTAVAAAAAQPAVAAGAAAQALPLPIEELLAAGGGVPPAAGPVAVEPGSPAMILYTSGTTGEAKGALISHAALVGHTAALADAVVRLDERDCVLGVLPLAHSFGCRMVMLASLHAGCRFVLPSRFDAAAALEVMIGEKVTWAPAVPTMFAAWGALPDGPRPARLRWCLAAGSPLAEETLRRAEVRLGVEIRQAYGMTEATISTVNAPPDPRLLGCVGLPAPGVEVRIVDEDDLPVAPGDTGQVLLRGPNLMSGYLDDPEATAEALAGGWMHSGDVGRLDASGRLYVVDRVKDLIIRGGNNVYPSEVEAALASHPGVREVAVVGRPDPYLGEEVVAIVVPSRQPPPSPEELRAWAAARVAATKVPREYATVDALPLGGSRKVLKRTLRAELAAGRLVAVRPAGPGKKGA